MELMDGMTRTLNNERSGLGDDGTDGPQSEKFRGRLHPSCPGLHQLEGNAVALAG